MDVDLGEMISDSRFIGMQLSVRGSKELREHGLTGIQAHVLLYILTHSEGTSLTEIHRETGYSMAATSGLIKRLRENGFVRVEPYKLDERRKLIFATEKSEKVHAGMMAAIADLPRVLYSGFTEEELEALNRLQKKMLKNLSVSDNCKCVMEG